MRRFAIAMVFLASAGSLEGARVRADAVAPPEPPALGTKLKLERVELLDGKKYSGLIESEDDAWIHLVEIDQTPGRPMHLIVRSIDRKKAALVVRLDILERAELRRQVEQFINRAPIEAGRIDAVELAEVEQDGVKLHRYRGKWFTLDSTLDELVTRQIIVRVEQVFTAYRQVLPPRVEPRRTLQLVIFGSPDEYRARLLRLGVRLDSRACFVQKENLVLAGSEVSRFASELAKVKAQHDQLRGELDKLEKKLRERLHALGPKLLEAGNSKKQTAQLLAAERRKGQDEIDKKQLEVDRCDRQNSQLFEKITRQMFLRLHHEAFHAYLENYVYPHEDFDVPLWLNEGLAVLFAGGLLESDSLRIDAPNAAALKRLKADLAAEQPLRLAKLLAADPAVFAAQSSDHADADRYYLYAWALVHYLTFEKHLLGSPALDAYVQPASAAADSSSRFEKLVGMPLSRFEPEWRSYVSKLR